MMSRLLHGCVLVAAWFAVATAPVAFAHDDASAGIAVSATGRAEMPPDRVVIDITIQTQENDLLEARDESDDEIDAILELGEKYGVRPADFRVTRSNIAYGFDEPRGRFFYRITRNAQITLNDVNRFDEFLAAAIKQGGFNIDDIDFETSQEEKLEAEARSKAMAAARDKAEQLAKLAGLKLGKARRIVEENVSQVDFSFSVSPSAAPQARRQGVTAGAGLATRDQFIAPGNPPAPVATGTHLASLAGPAAPAELNVLAAVPGPAKPRYGVITTTVRVEIEFEVVD
jgi:uncharacterized protein YggE